MASNVIKAPYGAADTLTVLATGATTATITNSVTVVTALTTLTGNASLTITPSSELVVGSRLLIKVKTTGTETFTFTSGIIAPVVTGVAGKTWCQGFWYDGTQFLPEGAKIQID